MSSTDLAAADKIDWLIRRLRPGWIRNPLAVALDRYERFAPLRRMDLPEGQRLCVIAPHPDDESIGCGGLLRLWTLAGRSAEVLFLTDGALGSRASRDRNLPAEMRAAAQRDTAARRRGEARVALELLGASAQWLGGRDGNLAADAARLTESLAAHWRSHPPDLLAAPFPADRHGDHAAAARIVADAAGRALRADLVMLGYEVWSPVPANAVLDVTPVAETKWQAIAAHESQVATTDYVSAARGLGAYRAITAGMGPGTAEAFHLAALSDYRALANRLRV
ncbi:PIG-L deacetylase family protein [Paracoccus ravus]|uniref:PIG-L deacetylase family protein n=1 Tax=Paracoccus ravus TaxID=2447760 RepID=UPI00106E38E4|nr:PIG-L deacetylase family protein [Paracoccus ravus]